MSVKSTCYLGIVAGIVIGVANLGAQVEVFTHTPAIPLRFLMIAMYLAMGCLGLVWPAMRSHVEGSLVAALGSLVGCGLGLLVAAGNGSSLEILIGYAAFGIGHGFIAGNHLLRVSAWLLGLASLLSAALLSNAQHDLLNPAAIKLAAISAVVMAVCTPALGVAIGLAMYRRLRSDTETLVV